MLKEIIVTGLLGGALISEYKKYEKKNNAGKPRELDEETIMFMKQGLSREQIPFAKELRKLSDDMIWRHLRNWDSSLGWRYDLLLDEAKRREFL